MGALGYPSGRPAMAQVEVRDRSIWTKHIHGDPILARRLEALRAGETVRLAIGGRMGVWQKMEDTPHGLPMPGLKPIGEIREFWKSVYESQRGSLIDLFLENEPQPAAAEFDSATEQERAAAWTA